MGKSHKLTGPAAILILTRWRWDTNIHMKFIHGLIAWITKLHRAVQWTHSTLSKAIQDTKGINDSFGCSEVWVRTKINSSGTGCGCTPGAGWSTASVSIQLTSHWGAKKGEISGLHKHLLLSFGLIGPLHGSGVLHYAWEIKWWMRCLWQVDRTLSQK